MLSDTVQKVLLVIIILLCLNYATIVLVGRLFKRPLNAITEPFTDKADNSLHVWLDNSHLYDKFYADIYDQLTSSGNRNRACSAFCMSRWKARTDPARMSLLDIGCGTGQAALGFAKLGVSKVCGLDSSTAMIEKCKENQRQEKSGEKLPIEWRVGDASDLSAAHENEFTHATLYYFSIYYLKDKQAFFKNLHRWIAPGGSICIEVVNKYKFDPMFQSAAPFLGFSLQKYTNKRHNTSKITFNKFEYEGSFNLLEEGDKAEAAEFREVITFKDSETIRRQKHSLYMPEIKEIIKAADGAGFQYMGYQDMMGLGFEYAYLLFFDKH
jgi:ubiquinone/menaquinone biosynthesis C-methylase UbiE